MLRRFYAIMRRGFRFSLVSGLLSHRAKSARERNCASSSVLAVFRVSADKCWAGYRLPLLEESGSGTSIQSRLGRKLASSGHQKCGSHVARNLDRPWNHWSVDEYAEENKCNEQNVCWNLLPIHCLLHKLPQTFESNDDTEAPRCVYHASLNLRGFPAYFSRLFLSFSDILTVLRVL